MQTKDKTPLAQTVISLSRGNLTLTYHSNPKSAFQLNDLLDYAERINPKRAFLFVSKVLGRHIPAKPSHMRRAFTELAKKIPTNLPQPVLVFGMAETAVGLSAGVHQVVQRTYPDAVLLNSTRHQQQAQLLATFSEDHSHASQHLIYQGDDNDLLHQVMSAKTIIMVDDEASTGNTCKNLVNALLASGLSSVEQVHLATLVDWSDGQLAHNPFDSIAFYRHHLFSGRWQWQEISSATVHMPKLDTTKAGSIPLLATGQWGRLPTKNSITGWEKLKSSLLQQYKLSDLSNKTVLVLGSNEFVWQPFLFAEWLEAHANVVKFSALTRSPISLGHAITTKISFQDNYGLGMTNFAYNVTPAHWDIICLCIETPKHSVDSVWLDMDNVLIINP